MILELEGVSCHFGGVRAVDGVDLGVDAGQLYGLIGPNGAGKSTLLDVISGFQPPTSGAVRFDGRDTRGMGPHHLSAAGLARTFQAARVFRGLTALENVLVGMHPHRRDDTLQQLALLPRLRGEQRKRVEEGRQLLARVGLRGVEDRFAGSLPFGAQRRLEIARALALNPRLLLLDEPVAGMTPAEAEGIEELLLEVNRAGLAMVLVEHHLSVVMRLCSRVAVLDFGRLIADGEPRDVVQQPAVMAAYLGRAAAGGDR